MRKKYKKAWNSKEEYEAHNARVEENQRRFRALLDKAVADLERRKAAADEAPPTPAS